MRFLGLNRTLLARNITGLSGDVWVPELSAITATWTRWISL